MLWRNVSDFLYRSYSDSSSNRGLQHKVSDFDKKMLVWTGKFKNISEVPSEVGMRVMDRARNKMRIKISNFMMLATLGGCLLMVYMGKQARERGETIGKRSEDWHRELRKEAAEK